MGSGAETARRSRCLRIASPVIALVAWVALLWGPLAIRGWADAEEPAGAAATFSDHAFALLNSLSTAHGDSKALLGPVASLAGDAQSLSKALGGGDRAGAAGTVAALESDRDAVESAARLHPGALDAAKWQALKAELEQLAKAVPPVPSSPPATGAEAGAYRGASPEGGAERGPGPKVKIESAAVDADNDIVRVKGWLEGRDLKSAGVYEGGREIRAFQLGPTSGSLRVNFDIQLERVTPSSVVRVYDRAGHSAEAAIAPAGEQSLGRARSGDAANAGGPTFGGSVEPAPPAAEEESAPEGSNTAEIPSRNPPSPSGRHVARRLHGHLGDVRIQIDNTTLLDPLLHEYQIVGQLAGSGIERAGIFVDGNMVEEIPTLAAGGFHTHHFSQAFVMNGREATVRVYGAGDQFVETSLQLAASGMTGPLAVPGFGYGYGTSPYGYGTNSYGGMTPYGVNPYSNGINPYGNARPGYNGYNTNPYGNSAPGYGTPYGNPAPGYGTPYGYPPSYPPPNVPWWQRLLH